MQLLDLLQKFLTVQSLVNNIIALKKCFHQMSEMHIPIHKKRKPREIVDIVFISEFWDSCVKLLRITIPLVKI